MRATNTCSAHCIILHLMSEILISQSTLSSILIADVTGSLNQTIWLFYLLTFRINSKSHKTENAKIFFNWHHLESTKFTETSSGFMTKLATHIHCTLLLMTFATCLDAYTFFTIVHVECCVHFFTRLQDECRNCFVPPSHCCRGQENVDLYILYPIRLHGIELN
jgi:hypothetical protein